jgi:site-specific recombinase XerD
MTARALRESDIVALLRACPLETPGGKRNRALIELLWRGGVRIGEAVGRGARPIGRGRSRSTRARAR